MPTARAARTADLEQLLDLFRVSEVSSAVEPIDQAHEIWRQTQDRDGVTVFVSESEGKIVATCMLITAPNLLRNGRGHAFLENVVTNLQFRGRGHGRAVVEAALSHAWAAGCYHVMRCSFEPGLRVAYVARLKQEC